MTPADPVRRRARRRIVRCFARYMAATPRATSTPCGSRAASGRGCRRTARSIVYTNHPSWWDPGGHRPRDAPRFPDRRGYGPMDAAALEKYRFLRRLGFFGIEPGTLRGAAAFLQTCRRVLEDPHTCSGSRRRAASPIRAAGRSRLRPGVAHLVAPGPEAVVLPLALEYPFWDERTPEALAASATPLAERPRPVEDWTRRLEAALTDDDGPPGRRRA